MKRRALLLALSALAASGASDASHYAPFEGGPTYDFYIESVRHAYRFGGRCTTTLGLTRGLPSSVYQDPSMGGILTQMHLGNAQRINGVYATGIPAGLGTGIIPVNPNTIPGLSAILSNTQAIFNYPQSKAPGVSG